MGTTTFFSESELFKSSEEFESSLLNADLGSFFDPLAPVIYSAEEDLFLFFVKGFLCVELSLDEWISSNLLFLRLNSSL